MSRPRCTPSKDAPAVRCRWCAGEVHGCHGRFSNWMHADTRSEFCPDGRLAEPQTPGQVRAMFARRKR